MQPRYELVSGALRNAGSRSHPCETELGHAIELLGNLARFGIHDRVKSTTQMDIGHVSPEKTGRCCYLSGDVDALPCSRGAIDSSAPPRGEAGYLIGQHGSMVGHRRHGQKKKEAPPGNQAGRENC